MLTERAKVTSKGKANLVPWVCIGKQREKERKGKGRGKGKGKRKGKKMSRGGLQELRILLDFPCTGL